ncbi:MAG: hypothetical protein HOY79_54110 [Streptomyces sp.]|nr:hypothetical protein [Streptomyces sp.]
MRGVDVRVLRVCVDEFVAEPATREVRLRRHGGLAVSDVPASAVAFHAILRAGATVTAVNVLSTASEIQSKPSAVPSGLLDFWPSGLLP